MDTEQALSVVRKIIEQLRDVHLVKPGPDPSESTFNWLVRWFQDEDNVAAGVALTPLLWLPQGYWACLAQALKGEGGYTAANALDLGLVVTLRAEKPCRVQTGEKRIRTSLTQGPARVSGTYEIRKLYTDVRAGDEITLPAHWAIVALMDHSQSGWEPTLWESSGAIPQKNRLREVGYELRGTDNHIKAPAKTSKRKAS